MMGYDTVNIRRARVGFLCFFLHLQCTVPMYSKISPTAFSRVCFQCHLHGQNEDLVTLFTTTPLSFLDAPLDLNLVLFIFP